ncbi:hypothetical protein U1T56_16090 [Geminicoccaceae bacterium SYSU G07066]|uniref:Thioredoxin-like fold domain-containing protein n=1 Tax=Benzoatithermus flavus TaxID=3108223 RepID=A0ABU8XXM1_9PROT
MARCWSGSPAASDSTARSCTKRSREAGCLAEVLADRAMARRLGLRGVPALVIGREGGPIERSVLVQGARPLEVLQAAVAQVASA